MPSLTRIPGSSPPIFVEIARGKGKRGLGFRVRFPPSTVPRPSTKALVSVCYSTLCAATEAPRFLQDPEVLGRDFGVEDFSGLGFRTWEFR